MAKRIGEKFVDQRVVLDEDEFFECAFTRCQLVYQGGEWAYLVGCRMEQCSFGFEGAAGRTLLFLQGMYRHMGPAGARLIEATFNDIRGPDPEGGDEDPGVPPLPEPERPGGAGSPVPKGA